jgi:hypothetical protein
VLCWAKIGHLIGGGLSTRTNKFGVNFANWSSTLFNKNNHKFSKLKAKWISYCKSGSQQRELPILSKRTFHLKIYPSSLLLLIKERQNLESFAKL